MVSAVANGGDHTLYSHAVESLEDKIRLDVNARNVRLTEYFKDFDRLRTGFITKPQFERCLDQLFGIVLTPEQDALLMAKYGSDAKQKGMVNYRMFCHVIGSVFDPNLIVEDPATQRPTMSNPVDRRPLSPASLAKCDELLMRMATHYKYHGINIKSCYADFDIHHIGVVTEPQFFRSFPGPPDITDYQVKLLARKYRDSVRPGLCNYYDFHFDIEDKQKYLQEEADFTKYAPTEDFLPAPRSPKASTLQEIFERIRVAVFKNGIRTPEFFRDHDKLRSGIITENQFICGLSLCCATQANLSRDEIQKVTDYYRTEDGRVRYQEFCDLMENAFTVPELEKKTTADAYRPPVGALAQAPNLLTEQEERRVYEILEDMRDKVRKRRLMAYPYFKDFDRSKGYTRGITKTQFARMLHFLTLDLQPLELALICKKFEYQVGGDINYPAFIQAIDTEYTGTATSLSDKMNKDRAQTPPKPSPPLDLSSVDLDELIQRIRHHVLVKRLRVEEFFQDFDPLRHGSISVSQFRQCLNSMGQTDLTHAQFQVLAQQYADPKRPGNVMWTQFLTDVEIGANQGLSSGELQMHLETIMQRMHQKILQRRILCKPLFQDFDKHNNGHVTRSQARQCLHNLGLTHDENEMKIIEARYSDDIGFNYIDFLELLQPPDKPDHMYVKRLEGLKLVNSKQMADLGEQDMETIMHKIKAKVMKERIRVLEFMRDYDKLRTGRMLRANFIRAMDMCCLDLTKREIEIIMDRYSSPGYPDYVDYARFSDDIEQIFTVKHLEKMPLVEPTRFNPHVQSENLKLRPEAEEAFERVMHRLADRVRIRRIQIFPLFEDYDKVHNGSVSRSQFNRVLSELDLGGLVSAREFEVLYQKFDVVIGLKHDFNYIGFCDTINDYANFAFGMP
ncbi:predicted protein [Nematostella vectensis]|uniref:EF-hand domain-containing protein n=1 Tax=Nematostella vectensis TaxID=45351 RepID=A7SSV0_NEMVE|nr:predicted protein [Nematostella vectensis]|eukprot:XP_001625316.1 predicted protein [Nematostella vectensis]